MSKINGEMMSNSAEQVKRTLLLMFHEMLLQDMKIDSFEIAMAICETSRERAEHFFSKEVVDLAYAIDAVENVKRSADLVAKAEASAKAKEEEKSPFQEAYEDLEALRSQEG